MAMVVRRARLPGTLEQNVDKIAYVVGNQVLKGRTDPYVRKLAEKIAGTVRGKDYYGEITTVYGWLLANVRYTRDPIQSELIQSPGQMAKRALEGQKILEDCESISAFGASILGALGHRTRVVFIDANPATKKFSHAIFQVWYAGKWVSVDATERNGVGWTPSHTKRMCIEPKI